MMNGCTRKAILSIVLCYIAISFCLIFVLDRDRLNDRESVGEKQVVEQDEKLCVIVPFRDRLEELKEFAPFMTSFLADQNIPHVFLVMNQTDSYRFNRASLINVGWLEAEANDCDYMVMHDVDLLPMNPEISYRFLGQGIVRHISAPKYHPKYNYTNFIGGILMLTMDDYQTLNGMSNKYWGWGLEDDEFFLRIRESDLNLTRVTGLSTNKSNSFRHIHGPKRKRDYAVVTKDQKAMKRKRDYISGLNNVKYSYKKCQSVEFPPANVTICDIKLECDLKWTPYCRFPKKKSV